MRVTVNSERKLPAPGLAEVRITAASPDVARQVAEALRLWFASTEQRSYPVGRDGTRLHLTVDTAHAPEQSAASRRWPLTGNAADALARGIRALSEEGSRARQ
jgi:hypothetical protein